jgi:hypothetical protein
MSSSSADVCSKVEINNPSFDSNDFVNAVTSAGANLSLTTVSSNAVDVQVPSLNSSSALADSSLPIAHFGVGNATSDRFNVPFSADSSFIVDGFNVTSDSFLVVPSDNLSEAGALPQSSFDDLFTSFMIDDGSSVPFSGYLSDNHVV